MTAVARVREEDLGDLLPLLRAYCDFYGVAPPDAGLLGLCRDLLAHPEERGVQLLARDADGAATGFATLYWTYDTLSARRVGVMYDLFVVPRARRRGLAATLIEACAAECRDRGVRELVWETAPDNRAARSVYERVGASASEWITYTLGVDPA